MGFSSQEYWSALPCLPPVDLANPGIELTSLVSPALADGFFTTVTFLNFFYLFFPLSHLENPELTPEVKLSPYPPSDTTVLWSNFDILLVLISETTPIRTSSLLLLL